MIQMDLPTFWYRCACCGLAHFVDPAQVIARVAPCPETGCMSPITHLVPYLERDWLIESSPSRMLEFVKGIASDRKFRLLACAYVRKLAGLGLDANIEEILSVSEFFADARVNAKELTANHNCPIPLIGATEQDRRPLLLAAALATSSPVALGTVQLAFHYGIRIRSPFVHEEEEVQTHLIREILGNPFCSMSLSTALPATVHQLVQAVYDGDASADSLVATLIGLDLPQFAEHFQQGEHPKGCWVLDQLLGKEEVVPREIAREK